MENSSLSGFRFIVDNTKSSIEKFMWLIVIFCAIFGLFYVLDNARESQEGQPFYMTLETPEYHIKNIIFPAVGICNHNRLKMSAVQRLVDIMYEVDNATFPDKEDLFDVAKMYGFLYDFAYVGDRASLAKFILYVEKMATILKDEHLKHSEIRDLLLSLTPTCEESILMCKWKNKVTNCSSLFRMRITQFGYCCTFNYYDTEAGRLPEDPYEPVDKPYTSDEAGRENGLTLVMHANTEEYLYATRVSYGFDILLFDRYDYADQTAGGLVHRLVTAGDHYEVELRPVAYYTTEPIKEFPLETRGCKFPDEIRSDFNGHFSYSNCLVRCRMRTIDRLCHCVPFFLPKRKNVSACTLEQLYCLNKYRQKLLFVYPPKDLDGLEIERENSLNCPQCSPDCVATRFKVTTKKILIDKEAALENMDNIDLKDQNISIVRIFYPWYLIPLYKIDVTLYWYELVSYIGGLCGIFAGFSMLSLAEVFYYAIIRFTSILVYNCGKNNL